MTATIPSEKPYTMPLNPPGLPDDPLLSLSLIVGWSWTWSDEKGKWDKPPLNARNGFPASVTAQHHWTTLDQGIAGAQRLGLDGIGIVLTGTEGVVGIDLDKCRDRISGAIAEWAQAIIDRFASYWEPSASGTGIRIFIRATLPPGRRRTGQIEMYDSGRYLTINGNPGPGASRHFEERQAELDAWHAELFPAPEPTPVHRGHPPTSADDQAVLDRCRSAGNGAKFRRLYDDGAWEGDYTSRSEARAATCSMLGFWVNRDPYRIESLFMGSALYDEKKWARERDRVLALASKGEAFDWTKDMSPPPASTLDTPPCLEDDNSLADLLALTHEDLARLAFDRGQLADERGRRLDAIDQLLVNPHMTEVEKVAAYVVVKAAAVAQERQPEDAPTRKLVVNQTAMACDSGISRQTFGKTLTRWTGQEYLRKEARGTGHFTKQGQEIQETVIELPARNFTDNLELASTWVRAADAKKQGGNGNRCPQCGSTKRKKTARTILVRTTIERCADCGHVHGETSKEIGEAKTFVDFYDTEPDIATIVDLATLRRPVSGVDTPPVADVANAATPPLSSVDTPPVPGATAIDTVVKLTTSGHPPPRRGHIPHGLRAGVLHRLLRGRDAPAGGNLDVHGVSAEAAGRTIAL